MAPTHLKACVLSKPINQTQCSARIFQLQGRHSTRIIPVLGLMTGHSPVLDAGEKNPQVYGQSSLLTMTTAISLKLVMLSGGGLFCLELQ